MKPETRSPEDRTYSPIEEQCSNLSLCVERLTAIIENQPGRKDLYVLRTLMENALANIQNH